MTRSVLRATIRKKLGETTAVYWQDSDLNQWIEDAQLDVVWQTRCKRQRTLATSVADTVRYTLTSLISNPLKVLSVRLYDSTSEKWRRLTQRTFDYLDKNYPEWESADPGQPIEYAYDVELNEFVLYPKADTAYVGTDYLEIYNVSKPTAIASDNASPDLPEVVHKAVIDYVVATGLESRGYQDIANVHWGFYSGRLANYMTKRDEQEDGEVVMHPERHTSTYDQGVYRG